MQYDALISLHPFWRSLIRRPLARPLPHPQFGAQGQQPGNFTYPTYIKVAADGSLLVRPLTLQRS